MSTNVDPQRAIAAWLEAEAPDRAPARLIDDSRERIRTTRQRPAMWPARRTSDMNPYAKWLIAAAAVLAVALVGYTLLPNRGGVGGPPVSASPSPSISMSPSASASSAAVLYDGQLQPGTYDARIPGTNVRVQFTVPAGWNWVSGWILTKGTSDPPDGHAIGFWAGDFQVYTDPCHWERALPDPPTGVTARDFVDALAAQPLRGDATPVERKGPTRGAELPEWSGWTIDTTVPADTDFSKCDRGEFRSWGPDGNARYHQGPGQRDTVWALDASPRRSIAVVAASFPTTPEQTMSEMAAILDSMKFSGS